MNPSVEVHHLVGKLSTAETLLRCNVAMFVIRERLYAHPVVKMRLNGSAQFLE